MNDIIIPTVGRIVHFYLNGSIPPTTGAVFDPSKPLPATICYVWNDDTVNLSITGQDGINFPSTSVYLRQPGQVTMPSGSCYCEWMPYQIKKKTGSESGEKAVGTEMIGTQAAKTVDTPVPAQEENQPCGIASNSTGDSAGRLRI